MRNCNQCSARDKGIFCDLESDELNDLSQHKVTNKYKRGQNLFFQGNPSMGLYCISSGKIKLSRVGNDGKETIIRIAGPGDILGHRSLFSHENYEASATVLEDSSICFLDQSYINVALKKNPEIALRIIEKLSRDLGLAEKRNSSLYQKNVRERLSELFLDFVQNYGVEDNNRIKLNIRLSRDEIASLIGSSHETVIRLISEFKEEGIVEVEGKSIFVTNTDKLRQFANLNDR